MHASPFPEMLLRNLPNLQRWSHLISDLHPPLKIKRAGHDHYINLMRYQIFFNPNNYSVHLHPSCAFRRPLSQHFFSRHILNRPCFSLKIRCHIVLFFKVEFYICNRCSYLYKFLCYVNFIFSKAS